ncbi:Hypothetical protein PHPALM_19714 [Phytophthora palmivora]|uniref:Uncharacterized protein n=1 Tax=Phytophthora palmivora TaxID=4796 RepID=A0A2P4XGR1_9STRA|nr:Hypothetical protein PHPALM_19714 [Phytophthora palmivora]
MTQTSKKRSVTTTSHSDATAAAASAVAASSATAAAVSLKRTVTIDLTSLKRPRLDQLKLKCIAPKLDVLKNTKKDDRVEILTAWSTNKGGIETLLQCQRNRAKKGECEEDTKRTKGFMFRLLNVLFSDRLCEAFLATGHQVSHAEIDQGGYTFWSDVSAAFGAGTSAFKTLISPDSMFEGVDSLFAMAHSAANLNRINLPLQKRNQRCPDMVATASRTAVVDMRMFTTCIAGSGREFCSVNLYADGEDDLTKEGREVANLHVNRKRRKSYQSADILEHVSELHGKETNETTSAMQKDTWNEQKLFIQEQRAAQKLTTLYSLLDRNSSSW